jgi:hypothetical protein
MGLSRREIPDLLRGAGGVLLAVGAVVLLARKSGHGWSSFALFLVVYIPAVVLYLLALSARAGPQSDEARPSQAILLVAAILLWPLALFGFLNWVGADTRHVLYDAGVFLLTGLLAAYASRRARVPYAALLAALALLVAWLFLSAKILSHPSAGTYRWLLLAGAVVLLAGAARLARASAVGAGEVATAGGLAAVAAGVLGVIVGAFVGVFQSITTLTAGSGATSAPHRLTEVHPLVGGSRPVEPIHIHTSGLQDFGWDLYLLAVSVALIWIGSRARVRGMGYAGGVGLVAFLVSVGAQITRLESGQSPTHSIVGWPLALLILGVVGLAAPVLYRRQP